MGNSDARIVVDGMSVKRKAGLETGSRGGSPRLVLLRLCLLRLVLESWKVLPFLGLTIQEACTCGILKI